jgi:alkyldihydroxyacetonephosphate synthase
MRPRSRRFCAPAISLDLGRLTAIADVDKRSLTAVLGAGLRGPDVERGLAAHGLTLGHFPQSFEYATVGGWVATRSAG